MAVVAVVAAVVAGCDPGLDERDGFVMNDTSQEIVVELVEATSPRQRATISQGAGAGSWSIPNDVSCLDSGLRVSSTDGEVLAIVDKPVCDGRRTVITDEDLAAPDASGS